MRLFPASFNSGICAVLTASLILLISLPAAFGQQTGVSVDQQGDRVIIRNRFLQLGFDLKSGFYDLSNARGETIVDQAYFQAGGLQSKDSCESRTWSAEEFADEIGKGKSLTVAAYFPDYADILWRVFVYDDQDFLVFAMGVRNDTKREYKLMNFFPLASRSVGVGRGVQKNYRVLDGNSGGVPTWVTQSNSLTTFNNILVKYGEMSQPDILVGGGATYSEFEKFAKVVRRGERLHLQLYAEDPVGKLIDPGQTYWPNDKFYFSFLNPNPFDALEKYADALQKLQKIELNKYDFPTVCLWWANVYRHAGTRKFNDSKGAVDEMDEAIKSGITKYTRVAVRLVPDAYGPNNQQGWWDDEHWAKWWDAQSADGPNYIAPYLTTESWSKAVLERGGIPITYMQSGRRSEDFVKLHPDWMLFNDPYKPVVGQRRLYQELTYPDELSKHYSLMFWSDKDMWGYDFTDTGFIRHLKGVYANLRKAGIQGIFYDYPEVTAWAFEGGFDDKYATTASAYRNMFRFADEGLEKSAYLQERNITRGSDIALGLIESQRIWADETRFIPEMVSRTGLRWYKNRKVINYDHDSKDPQMCFPAANKDGARGMYTMCYVTGGRFLLARSFSQFSPEEIHDMSRIFPYHLQEKSARPIDAFNEGVTMPRIYDFAVDSSWHQLTFFNDNFDSTAGPLTISVKLDASLNEGGLGLDSRKSYYVYDFWNDRLVGLFSGDTELSQDIRPGEARMMSVHAKKDHPQFISTNRHIMQGYVDLKDVKWDARKKELSGTSSVVEGDPYTVVIASNGFKAKSAKAGRGKVVLKTDGDNQELVYLTITAPKSGDLRWTLKF